MSPADPYSASPGSMSCPNCGAVYAIVRDICTQCGAALHPFAGEYSAGAVIDDKYEVVSLLGAGGMGEVYKAKHLHLNAFRCIKVMRKSLLADETFRMRFIREARLATQIQHPNIALLHDFSTLPNGSYYMVWEFIDGTSVRQWAETHGRFPLDVAVDIALQVLAGLEHCHRRGLLHRDISPDNIMIANDPDELIVKIIDLGIAKMVSSEQAETTTQVGLYVGNPKYSSPEQLGGLEDGEALDGRTDLYSLGVVLYEMLLGVPLFKSKTPQGYVIKHLTQVPPRFEEIDADFVGHDALEQIVLKALEKDRSRRYASARDFSTALRRFQLDRAAAIGVDSMATAAQRSRKLMLDAAPSPAAEPQPTPDAFATVVKRIDVRAGDDQEAWLRASAADTFDAYEEFLRQYASSERSAQARARIERLMLDRIDELELQRATDALTSIVDAHAEGSRVGDSARRALARIGAGDPHEDDTAWSTAMSAASADAWRQFLQEHPRSPRAPRARQMLEETSLFEAASAEDSVEGWRQFLAVHPHGLFAADAKVRLDSAVARAGEREALDRALASDSIEELTDFLRRFPLSKSAEEARRAVSELSDLAAARAADDADVWSAFLESWGEGKHAAEGKRRVAEIESERDAFGAAENAGTAAALQEFLLRYRDGRNAARASELLKEASAFERVASSGVDELEAFLAEFPEGAHAAAARSLRDRAVAASAFEQASKSDTTGGWREFLSRHGTADAELRDRARARLAAITKAAFDAAVATRTTDSLEQFLRDFPTSAHADEARALVRTIRDEAIASKFLAAHEPQYLPPGITSLEPGVLAWLIRSAEEQEKIEHLTLLSKNLESKPLRKTADEARVRLSQALRKKELEEVDWDAAESAATSARWRGFLKKHPDSPRAAEARIREGLAHEYEAIAAKGSIEALRAYLELSKDEALRARAAERIDELERQAGAGEKARASGSPLGVWKGIFAPAAPSAESAGDATFIQVPPPPPAEPSMTAVAAPSGADEIETIVTKPVKKAAEPAAAEPPAMMERPLASEPAMPREQPRAGEAPVPAAPAAESSARPFLATSAAPMPADAAAIRKPIRRRKRISPIYYAIPIVLAVVLAGLIGGGYLMIRYYRNVPPPPQRAVYAGMAGVPQTSMLVLDARPWGAVTSVRDVNGKEYARVPPEYTPTTISVPPGDYTVMFSNSDVSQSQQTVKVTVLPARTAFCSATFRPVDVKSYFSGAGW